MQVWRESCPAKLNLYLAVTGRRSDGFHELVSLVAPVALHDELSAGPSPSGCDTLTCDDATLAGPDNLVLKAAAAYRKRVPDAPFFAWSLAKRLPYGAGMGGGSSDAVGALRILNAACNCMLVDAELSSVAAEVGSDCPLFLKGAPCVMSGRGEILETLPEIAARHLSGRTVAIVKPHFGVPTGWAYGAIDKANAFTEENTARAELAAWLGQPEAHPPVRNSFMDVVYRKYPCYDALNERLRAEGLPGVILTGSGSAAYALADNDRAEKIASLAAELFGPGSFSAVTALL